MIRFLSFISILIWFSSCTQEKPTYLDDHSVIIKEHRYYSNKYKTYIPSQEDIGNGLVLFKKAIEDSDYFFKDSPDILDFVYKQYFGYFEEGSRILLINCLCKSGVFPESQEQFKTELIIPDDGGICYFRAYINLDKNTVDLLVNGD